MERKGFNSTFGMIMAAVGSAVGLGNIWRFPYIVGTNGGGAFLLIYIIFSFVIGVPLLMTEMLIGRKAKSDAVDSFKKLAPKKKWYVSGGLGALAAFLILSFYGVVAGWSLDYVFKAATNQFAGKSAAEIEALFTNFITAPIRPIICTFIFLAITMIIVKAGVERGIEKVSKVLIPLLLIIVFLLGVRGIFLDNGVEGLKFLFIPDFSKLTMPGVLAALGHSFFSLSLGMAIMITYGSYVKDDENIASSAFKIAILDLLVAVFAGVAIFTAVFSFGLEPGQGAGLVFVTLPNVFPVMPGGYLFGVAFFVLLSLAALTSTISLLETSVAFGVDSLKLSRNKASWLSAVLIFLIAIFCSLSNGSAFPFKFFGKSLFDFLDHITANYMIVLAALIEIIFIGWGYRKTEVFNELTNNGKLKFDLKNAYYIAVKYIIPIAMIIILLSSFGILKSA